MILVHQSKAWGALRDVSHRSSSSLVPLIRSTMSSSFPCYLAKGCSELVCCLDNDDEETNERRHWVEMRNMRKCKVHCYGALRRDFRARKGLLLIKHINIFGRQPTKRRKKCHRMEKRTDGRLKRRKWKVTVENLRKKVSIVRAKALDCCNAVNEWN